MNKIVKLVGSLLVVCLCSLVPGSLCAKAEPASVSLSLSLTGTVIDKKVGNTAVIMDEKEQKQYLLHEGDTILDAVVRKVERERVVLFRDGQEEILGLKNRKGQNGPEETKTKAETEAQSSKSAWRVRLTVMTDDGRRDRSNILGRFKDSKQGRDRHDLPEMPPPPSPMGDRYLSIVFPHPEWKAEMPDYSSDFHSIPVGPDTDDVWTFEIRTYTPDISAKLSWEGPADVLARSRIRDVDSGRVLVADCAATDSLSLTLEKDGVPLSWEYRARSNEKAGVE